MSRKKMNLIGYPVIIMLTILITHSCLNEPKKPIVEEETVRDPYAANGKPKNIINFKEIADLYYRYDGRAELIEKEERNTIKDFEAARSITFDYQEIKNYIKFIEQNSIDANVKISGLRFYFGKYPDDTTKTKRGRQVLFFNPTIDTLLAGDKEKSRLAYAIKREGKELGIEFLKDIIKRPEFSGTEDPKNMQKNEATVLSFLNFFNATTIGGTQSQAEQGGQTSPPPKELP